MTREPQPPTLTAPDPTKRLIIRNLFQNSEYPPGLIMAIMGLLADASPAQKLGVAQAVMFDAIDAEGKRQGLI